MLCIGISFAIIGAGIVAAVIVLSLIPIYLPRKDVNIQYYKCQYHRR